MSTRKGDLNNLAQSALGGGIDVTFQSGNNVNIAFERTVSDAGRTYSAYNSGNGLLYMRSNVLVQFSTAPTDAELTAITQCLVGAR